MLAKTLLGYTGNTENLFLESEKTLQSVSGIKSDIFSSQARKNALEIADKEIEFIEKNKSRLSFLPIHLILLDSQNA